MVSPILPKNELENSNFCPSLLGQKFFVCFLGELKKTKCPFEIKWPLVFIARWEWKLSNLKIRLQDSAGPVKTCYGKNDWWKLHHISCVPNEKCLSSKYILPSPLSICTWFLQFSSLKYPVWWTWFSVYFKLEFYRLQQAEKSSSD